MAQKIVINNTGSTPKSYINESKTTLVNVKDLDKILQAIAGFGLKYQISNNTLEVDLDDIGGVDGIVTTKGTQTLENKTIDLSDNDVINQIEVTYEQLTALITSNGLKKGNKYLITDFQETWNGGSKPVEQIVVTASSPNTLERVAASVTNPSDYIEYTTSNSLITGATKGVILKRIDSSRNEFGYGYNNNFGDYSNSNACGNGCHSNTLMQSASGIIFKTGCRLNSIGADSDYVVFGNNCINNTLGDYCDNNYFSDECELNQLSSLCSGNYFNRGCVGNILGANSNNNIFNQICSYNTLGGGCNKNTFQFSISNTFGNNYKNNYVIGVSGVNFTTATYTTWKTHLQADYQCKIFYNSAGVLCLQYVNSYGQTVTLTAE